MHIYVYLYSTKSKEESNQAAKIQDKSEFRESWEKIHTMISLSVRYAALLGGMSCPTGMPTTLIAIGVFEEYVLKHSRMNWLCMLRFRFIKFGTLILL